MKFYFSNAPHTFWSPSLRRYIWNLLRMIYENPDYTTKIQFQYMPDPMNPNVYSLFLPGIPNSDYQYEFHLVSQNRVGAWLSLSQFIGSASGNCLLSVLLKNNLFDKEFLGKLAFQFIRFNQVSGTLVPISDVYYTDPFIIQPMNEIQIVWRGQVSFTLSELDYLGIAFNLYVIGENSIGRPVSVDISFIANINQSWIEIPDIVYNISASDRFSLTEEVNSERSGEDTFSLSDDFISKKSVEMKSGSDSVGFSENMDSTIREISEPLPLTDKLNLEKESVPEFYVNYQIKGRNITLYWDAKPDCDYSVYLKTKISERPVLLYQGKGNSFSYHLGNSMYYFEVCEFKNNVLMRKGICYLPFRLPSPLPKEETGFAFPFKIESGSIKKSSGIQLYLDFIKHTLLTNWGERRCRFFFGANLISVLFEHDIDLSRLLSIILERISDDAYEVYIKELDLSENLLKLEILVREGMSEKKMELEIGL